MTLYNLPFLLTQSSSQFSFNRQRLLEFIKFVLPLYISKTTSNHPHVSLIFNPFSCCFPIPLRGKGFYLSLLLSGSHKVPIRTASLATFHACAVDMSRDKTNGRNTGRPSPSHNTSPLAQCKDWHEAAMRTPNKIGNVFTTTGMYRMVTNVQLLLGCENLKHPSWCPNVTGVLVKTRLLNMTDSKLTDCRPDNNIVNSPGSVAESSSFARRESPLTLSCKRFARFTYARVSDRSSPKRSSECFDKLPS